MKRTCSVVLVALVLLVAPLTAKLSTVKLTVTGGSLTHPLDITSGKALANIWAGDFLGDLSEEPAAALPRYTVAFFAFTAVQGEPLAVSSLRQAAAIPVAPSVQSRQSPDWKDPSPHLARFIRVTDAVRLEVLDWGGTGRPAVLLAGGGDTSHVFDSFAPKLTTNFHVYGITRRGFGASGFSSTESGADRLVDDVAAVLDSLHLERPVLVGHSIGGAELTGVATKHRGRVAALVYLDAAYPYAFDNGQVPSLDDFQSVKVPEPPPPTKRDLSSFAALIRYYRRVLGFTYPEAELRQRWTANPDGSVGTERTYPGSATLLIGLKKYTAIPASALLLFAKPHSLGTWVDNATDPRVRQAAKDCIDANTALIERQMKALEDAVPSARIVTVPRANHYIYLSNEADVLREMHSFLDAR